MGKGSILVSNITMQFKLSSEKVESFKEYFLKMIKNDLRYNEFTALNQVSFMIGAGQCVGIIGPNGAGKSTLLKIISGVIKPTSGNVYVDGKIAPLLELGAGFDPDFTGAENIYLNGALLGYSKEFLNKKYEDIVEFAELGQFINVPVKNYSSGMRAKLGFSIATQVDPDILIVDEVLAVGDQRFRKKSFNKMKSLMESGKTVILVSHNLDQVQNMMDEAIWLDQGKIIKFADAKSVVSEYRKYMNQ